MRSREAALLPLCARAACLALAGSLAGGSLACSPEQGARAGARPADPGSGWTDAPRASASPSPRPPDERWDLADQLRRLQPATQRARSEHLGGDADGEVLASPGSGYPLRGPTAAAPPGATLVEQVFAPEARAPEAYFVMTKHPAGYDPAGGDWEYLVVLPDGRIEERGKLPLCARCHAEAPHDRLFGGGR